MVNFSPIPLGEIARIVNGSFAKGGLADHLIDSLAEPREATKNSVAFLITESFFEAFSSSSAGCVVVDKKLVDRFLLEQGGFSNVIATDDAYLSFAKLTNAISKNEIWGDWSNQRKTDGAYVSASAVVAADVKIGQRSQVLDNVVVGEGCEIGSDVVLFPGVVLYPRTKIGNRVRIHANAVVGADGFGYARGAKGSEKIWHLGRVLIGNDVEIGAGTTIDRGTIRDTVIEDGAKIDNLCQIGHNAWIKSHAILCAQTGLAGNVTIGRGAILAGKVGVADKLEIGDGALIGPMSGLSKDVPAGGQVMGQHPAKSRREWWNIIAHVERLPEFFKRLKEIEKKLDL